MAVRNGFETKPARSGPQIWMSAAAVGRGSSRHAGFQPTSRRRQAGERWVGPRPATTARCRPGGPASWVVPASASSPAAVLDHRVSATVHRVGFPVVSTQNGATLQQPETVWFGSWLGHTMAFNLSSWLHRKRVQAEVRLSGRPVQSHRVTYPYHAVSIDAGASCRQTAKLYGGRRYLSPEAPAIPLPTCDTSNCRCRYVHHEDRRESGDRRLRDVWDPHSPKTKGADRRASHGRRVTDH